MFQTIDKAQVTEFHYDSVTEWNSEITVDWKGWHEGSKYHNSKDAYNASLSANEYAEQIRAISSRIAGQVQMSIPDLQPSMDVVGLGYDVGLALSGVPECWLTMTPSKDPKVVKILYHTSVRNRIEAKQIMARGIAVCALITCLETAGINTEVVLVADCNMRTAVRFKDGIRYFITFKKPDDYFDLEKFSFAICDPSFRRMLGFSWCKSKAGVTDGEVFPQCDTEPNQQGYDMYFKKLWDVENEFATLELTKTWVIAKCREFGVEISNPPLA